MPNKSSSVAKRSSPSASSRRKAKTTGQQLTSEGIAADIAAFLKRGGQIEVLGNTSSRSLPTSTAFRSNPKAKRKATPVHASKKAAHG